MKKTIELRNTVADLRAFLLETDANEIIVRTTYIHEGNRDDVECIAQCAGFGIGRFTNPEYRARHEFAECYKLRRMKPAR